MFDLSKFSVFDVDHYHLCICEALYAFTGVMGCSNGVNKYFRLTYYLLTGKRLVGNSLFSRCAFKNESLNILVELCYYATTSIIRNCA